MRRGGRRRGHRRHGRVGHTGLLYDPQEGSAEPAAHLVHLLQSVEAAELPEEEHAAGQAAVRHIQQHRVRAVVSCRASLLLLP